MYCKTELVDFQCLENISCVSRALIKSSLIWTVRACSMLFTVCNGSATFIIQTIQFPGQLNFSVLWVFFFPCFLPSLMMMTMMTTTTTMMTTVWCWQIGSVTTYLETAFLPEEEKGCHRMSRWCKNQLLVSKMIMSLVKKHQNHLCMAWIYGKKTFNNHPHTWIVAVMEMYQMCPTVRLFLEASKE